MAILNIFSPGWVNGGMATQFVPNPWGTPDAPAGDVWVQCTVPAMQVNQAPSLGGFGIIEIAFLDGNGNPQTTTFGDVGNLDNVVPEDLPPRLFVPQMLSVTLAHIVADLRSTGTVTLFQWG
ncbi:MAG: hypothetical protein JWO83_2154 [Caulobacteraceae bacterium]|jgi:hypothetical protein|nr:hypothetical protein [Caulobacteraceae bacterium]